MPQRAGGELVRIRAVLVQEDHVNQFAWFCVVWLQPLVAAISSRFDLVATVIANDNELRTNLRYFDPDRHVTSSEEFEPRLPLETHSRWKQTPWRVKGAVSATWVERLRWFSGISAFLPISRWATQSRGT